MYQNTFYGWTLSGTVEELAAFPRHLDLQGWTERDGKREYK